MIRFFVFACLLAAAAAQRIYYCNSGSAIITDRDFFFVTRRGPNEWNYPGGLICELNINVDSGIMLDIQSFVVRTAILTVTEGRNTLYTGSSPQKYQYSLAATSGSMKIRFDATNDYSNSEGVKMRIRLFENNRCPSGWTYLYGTCFGTSNVTGDLSYTEAQRACNNMKANLLQLPANYVGQLGSFMRMLPTHLKLYYTYIGLTDKTSWGQYNPYWLNGVRQFSTSEISCVSGGLYSSCYSYERCGTFNDRSFQYAIFMGSCISVRDYACSMPPGGSGIFYRVPDSDPITYPSTYTNYGIVWGSVVGGLFIVSLIIGGIYAGVRSSYVHRSAGATSVVVSTGRVTVSPPTVAYPVQQNLQPPPPPMYPSPQGPLYPAPPPPAYNMVVGEGYNNSGYNK